MLLLDVGDRAYYIKDPARPEFMVYGDVVQVIPWTQGRKGFTWYVRFDHGGVGEFRSDSDKGYLFKSYKPREETMAIGPINQVNSEA